MDEEPVLRRDDVQFNPRMENHGSVSRTALLVTLGAVTLLALGVRVPSIVEPLGIDQGFWASSAHEMARGQVLYRDVWDHKPPGAFLMYLAAFQLLGWKAASVAWFDILASVAATLLLFVVLRRLGGSMMGAIGAAWYAAMTIPGWLYRYGGFLERSVAETYIVVLMLSAAWCAIGLRERASTLLAVGLGLAGGTAVVSKPNAGIYVPALLLWLGLYARLPRARTIRHIVVASVAAAVVPLLTLLWLWTAGALTDARIALIDFNRAYVSEGFTPAGYALNFARAVWLRIRTEPLWTAGAIGSTVALWGLFRSRRLDETPALAIALGGGAAIAIAANGARLYNSYFIQALPPLAVMGAWLFAGVIRRARVHQAAAVAMMVLSVVMLARRSYPERVYEYVAADLEQLLGRGDRATYLERFGSYANNRGYSARANSEMTTYLRERTSPDDLLYFFGTNYSEIYFATDRPMANRFLRSNPFVPSTFHYPGFSLADVTRELASKRPVYLVIERLHTPTRMGVAIDGLLNEPDVLRLLDGYRLEARIEDFTVYRLTEPSAGENAGR
jgi:Dolichyl-phosphate-mannose-protein mannosyltransferase